MKRIFCVIALLILAVSTSAYAAGTAIFTAEQPRGTTKWKLTWVVTSDGDGNVSAPTTSGTGYDSAYYGTIHKVIVTPAADALQPSADFDVDILTNKSSTVDIAQALLTDCSNSAPTVKSLYDGLIYPLSGEVITPSVSGMGDSNSATIEVWIQ